MQSYYNAVVQGNKSAIVSCLDKCKNAFFQILALLVTRAMSPEITSEVVTLAQHCI